MRFTALLAFLFIFAAAGCQKESQQTASRKRPANIDPNSANGGNNSGDSTKQTNSWDGTSDLQDSIWNFQ